MPASKKRFPLPKRFNAAVSEKAYAQLRAWAEETDLGNNYVLTVLLENADALVDKRAFQKAVERLKRDHCA
ncbi:MAG: hypothetical protein ACFBZ8_00220 [Opitutales bacterium]